MLTPRQCSDIERDIRDLDALTQSPGWALLMAALDADVQAATDRLVSDPTLTVDQLHYRRGLVAAARNFTRLPEAMTARLQGELLLAPATAGKKDT